MSSISDAAQEAAIFQDENAYPFASVLARIMCATISHRHGEQPRDLAGQVKIGERSVLGRPHEYTSSCPSSLQVGCSFPVKKYLKHCYELVHCPRRHACLAHGGDYQVWRRCQIRHRENPRTFRRLLNCDARGCARVRLGASRDPPERGQSVGREPGSRGWICGLNSDNQPKHKGQAARDSWDVEGNLQRALLNRRDATALG